MTADRYLAGVPIVADPDPNPDTWPELMPRTYGDACDLCACITVGLFAIHCERCGQAPAWMCGTCSRREMNDHLARHNDGRIA